LRLTARVARAQNGRHRMTMESRAFESVAALSPEEKSLASRMLLLTLILGASMSMAACARASNLSGSWIVTNTPSDASSPPFLSVATFTADGGYVGAAQGSGACCPILTPGHGVWRNTGANDFLVTFISLGYDDSGDLMGTLTGRLEVRMDPSGNQFGGEFAGTMVAPGGAALFTIEGTVEGERIEAP
jgi:hypothetical protein